MKKGILALIASLIGATCLAIGLAGCQPVQGEQGIPGENGDKGDSFWTENPQGLDFYPLDDGTFAVGKGQAILLSEITVPETFNDKPVTAVYDFSGCENLTTINLPASVNKLYEGAFAYCEKLENVYVAGERLKGVSVNEEYFVYDSDIAIGEKAFIDTLALTRLIIDDSFDNDTKVSMTVKNNLPEVTKIEVSAALNSNTDFRRLNTVNLDASKKEESFELDFGTYGLFKDIDVKLFNGAEEFISLEDIGGVAISADEYNFAPLTASYPVLVYSLKLNEITDNGKIPTFVCMDRYNQYNWNNLPYNMQIMPFVKSNEVTNNSAFHSLRAGISRYIKELFEINPESKFNLYVGDNYGEVILEMFTANRIPESNWTATLLSDGTATAYILSDTFAVDNPDQKYSQMKENYEEIERFVYDRGEFNIWDINSKIEFKGTNGNYQILERYAYVMARERANVKWIVNRLRATENLNAINEKDPNFVTELLKHVEQVYTNNLLAALSLEEAENFKKLYKFNDGMFNEAEEQNKEVIIILGTSWDGENGNLYDNIKMLVELYGTENYVYYYKGHPGYPTSQYEGRKRYFETLKEEGYAINELDNAIAAEIILFFKPDVFMAGYETSTFDSVQSDEKALLLFGSKDHFLNGGYTFAKYFDVFASQITDNDMFDDITLTDGVKYYLIEYNNTAEYENQVENYSKHEIAIYNTTTKEIEYYKLKDGAHVKVDKDGNVIGVEN